MKLFCFGLGYSASFLADRLQDYAPEIIGTTRSIEKIETLERQGIKATLLEDVDPDDLATASHILISIPPDETLGDLVYHHYHETIAQSGDLDWLGYLSTTGVYGDHDGQWVDETTPTNPEHERSQRRVEAENQWLGLHAQHIVPTHIFRLAGIYGPTRNVFANIAAGKAKSIDKPGQVFSRIHVEDIAGILVSSMERPRPGEIYNVCDDLPCSTVEVNEFAAELLGCPPPPVVPFTKAQLSPMQQEFYASNRKVRNHKAKQQLAYNLLYPSYKEGLLAIQQQQQYAL